MHHDWCSLDVKQIFSPEDDGAVTEYEFQSSFRTSPAKLDTPIDTIL